MIAGPGAPDFVGLARQVNGAITGAWISRHAEWRVPKRIPFFSFDKVGCQRAMQASQCLGLRRGKAAHSAGHLELRQEIATQDKPSDAIGAGGQFVDDGLLIPNRKFRPQLLIPLAAPPDLQYSFANRGLQPVERLVFIKVAVQSLSCSHSREQHGAQQ